MKVFYSRRSKLMIFVGLFVCLHLGSCTIPPAPILEQSGDKGLATLLEGMRRKAGQPALAGAVVANGKIVAEAAVGTRIWETKNWVSVNDSFNIASCGKAFTATLAAKMVEEGLLRWDTTLRDVFPKIPMRAEYEDISLQQLLSHRAGLIKNIEVDLDRGKTCTWTSGRMAYFEELSQIEPAHPPGTAIFYSNAGYLLAGLMMEHLSGKEFMELMSEKVFNPLGLKTAGYGPPAKRARMSQPWGHYWDNSSRSLKATLKDDLLYISPGGNVSISMGDWARFIIQHMSSAQLTTRPFLDLKTVKKLHTPEDGLKWGYDQDYFDFWYRELGWPLTESNYALGWFVTEAKDGSAVLNHGGTSRAFQAEVYLSPKTKNAILLATNSRIGHIHLYRTALAIKEHYRLELDIP